MPVKSKTDIEFDEKIIEAVRNRPILWNKELNEYREANKHDRDLKWNEIGSIVGLSGSKARDKFQGLRNNFNQVFRKVNEHVPSGSAAPETPPKVTWPHFSSMLFLRDTIKNANPESNLEDGRVFDGVMGASKQQDSNDSSAIPIVDNSQQVNEVPESQEPIDEYDDYAISTLASSSSGTSGSFAPITSTPGPSRAMQRLNSSFNQSGCIRPNGKRSKESFYEAELRAQEQTYGLLGELIKKPKKGLSTSGKILMSFEEDLNKAESDDKARFRLIFSKLFLGFSKGGTFYLEEVETLLNNIK